jgi:hypothetical protein
VKLESDIKGCTITGKPGRSSSFEVTANGQLVHSKLGGQGGKLQTPAEYQALMKALEPLIE